MIDEKVRDQVKYLYKNEQLSKSLIARKLGLSRNTVDKILKEKMTNSEQNEQLREDYKRIRQEQYDNVLETVRKDDRIAQAVDIYLNILSNEKTIKKELQKPNGMRNIVGAFKTLVDSVGKATELDLRTNNPEAFAGSVTIINDADEVAKIKKERKELVNSESVVN